MKGQVKIQALFLPHCTCIDYEAAPAVRREAPHQTDSVWDAGCRTRHCFLQQVKNDHIWIIIP